MKTLPQIRTWAGRSISGPVASLLVKTKLTPNMVTITGFLVCMGAAVAIGMGHLILGGALALGSGVFDMLDGALARAQKSSTKFGALLDSTLDRISDAALILGLIVYYAWQGQPWLVFLAAMALIGSFSVSYIRARAEGLGLECKEGLFTRPERLIVLSLGLMVHLEIIALWILAVMGFFTAAQRFFLLYRQLKRQGNP
jgi:CDP-diacylglycerol---glycerol-3-phosphate 3-phosphatidyltransferase